MARNSGDGYGYGDGSGYGDGDGDGSGSGYGDGYGDGSGSGSGDGYETILPEESAFAAFHYIRKRNGAYATRQGHSVIAGETLHEPVIRMCESGLHASFTREDARTYSPRDTVLTSVKVWGKVIIGHDKLVATHRKIVCEVAD